MLDTFQAGWRLGCDFVLRGDNLEGGAALNGGFRQGREISTWSFCGEQLAFVSKGLRLKPNLAMSGGNTILYAEDDENDAFLFLTALAKAGVRNPVVHVLNGEEALWYLAGTGVYSDRTAHPLPCLLVTDLKMPRLSGFDLLAEAKPILDSNHLPALVLSASVSELDKQRSLQLGAQKFFVKPADLNGLLALANELKHCWLSPATLPV